MNRVFRVIGFHILHRVVVAELAIPCTTHARIGLCPLHTKVYERVNFSRS